MFGKILIALTFTCALCVSATAQDAKSVLEATIKNMGDIKSAQYSGSGAQFNLGQSVSPDAPWPRVELKSFTRTVDYDKQASRNETVNAQGALTVQFLSGDKAWGQAGANVTTSATAVTTERQLQILMTPHGFLKGALANKATAKKSGKATLVTFIALGKYKVVGVISAENLVEKVETRLDNAVLGDMLVETTYSDYRDFGGLKFPAKMAQKQGGHPVFDLAVTEAKANVALDLSVPDTVRQATPPAAQVTSEKLADGVWYLAGGTHHSVAVEFADHVAVIEAPPNPNPNMVNLYENIQRLNLDVNRIAPLHGRVVELAELKRTIGK